MLHERERELEIIAQTRSMAVAVARGSDLEVSYAWGLVRQWFEARLRALSDADRERTLAGAAAIAGPIVLAVGGSDPV
jgi:hypothetical protein